MSDLEREIREIGERIWADVSRVRQQVMQRRDRGWRRLGTGLRALLGPLAPVALIVALAGGATAAVLVHQATSRLAVAARSGGPGAGAGSEGSAPQGSGGQGSAVGGAGSSGSGGSHGSGPSGSSSGSSGSAGTGSGGSGGSGQPAPTPPSSFPPTPPTSCTAGQHTITITQNNVGTIVVPRGTTVVVRLGPPFPSTYAWSVPQSSNPFVLCSLGRSTSSNGDATATFVANALGQANVEASEGPRGCPGCPGPSRLWKVAISVT